MVEQVVVKEHQQIQEILVVVAAEVDILLVLVELDLVTLVEQMVATVLEMVGVMMVLLVVVVEMVQVAVVELVLLVEHIVHNKEVMVVPDFNIQ